VTVHSEFGASSCYRWSACPGSVALSRDIPRRDTVFSLEGTAAHALGEMAYQKGRPADTWLGAEIEGVEVTENMVDAVNIYLEFLKETIESEDAVFVEHRITLEKLNPPAPMFGTADMLIYRRAEKKLWVVDYKHGQGVPVEAKGNKQLRYYALGGWLALGNDQPVDEIEAVIVQPRAPHQDGPIRSETFTSGELLDFYSDISQAVELALQDDAPLVTGGHCKFCPAAAQCPARKDYATELAQVDFSSDVLSPLDPRLLPVEQVGDLLTKVDILKDWITSLERCVKEKLEAGESVPGWKLVNKRPMRKWAATTEEIVNRLSDVKDSLFTEPEILSPAKIEKIVGKKRFPSDLVVSISSGLTLAPEHDKRPAAAVDAASEFAALTVKQ